MAEDKSRISHGLAIAASGVAILRFLDGIMDQRMYLVYSYISSIKKLELSGQPILLQNNDPKHYSNLVKHWMLYNIKSKLDHPAQSPDLNVIEHLWDYLKKKVKESRPTSKSTLKQVLSEEWNKIPPEFTRKLALSIGSFCSVSRFKCHRAFVGLFEEKGKGKSSNIKYRQNLLES